VYCGIVSGVVYSCYFLVPNYLFNAGMISSMSSDSSICLQSRRKTREPKEENVTLGPTVREGEFVFGVAHIFASFNDTFIVSIVCFTSAWTFHSLPMFNCVMFLCAACY